MAETYLRYVGNGAFHDSESKTTFEQYGPPQAVPAERAEALKAEYPNSFEDAGPDEPALRDLIAESQRVEDPDTGDVRYRHPDGTLRFEPTVTGDQIEEANRKLAELRLEAAGDDSTKDSNDDAEASYFTRTSGVFDDEADSAENK